MECILDYVIDVVGDLKELDGVIPADHVISLVDERYSYNEASEQWIWKGVVLTYLNDTHEARLPTNKAFTGNVLTFVSATHPTIATIKTQMQTAIDNHYGANHWTLQ